MTRMVYDRSGEFSEKPRLIRFFFYLISSCRLKRYSAWVEEGEPNPFVKKERRVRSTCQMEITDIFEDSLKGTYRK